MKVFKKIMLASVMATGFLVAYPDSQCQPGSSNCKGPASFGPSHVKAPEGVLNELYRSASFKQKREILQIEYDNKKSIKAQTEKFKTYREALQFDIKGLYIDLEEAKFDRDNAKATEILHRIVKKQEDLRKSKQDEKNLRYLLEEDKIKKINNVLRVK